MIHYHGLPITPDVAAVPVVLAGHAFVSWRHRVQLRLALEACQSLALDNGAFSAWSEGKPITDWGPFYKWAGDCYRMPPVDFAVIPDVIDGDEAANDRLINEWPLPRHFGAPVWHMHESFERLVRLVNEWPRVCIGSSGAFKVVGSPVWWERMRMAMLFACDVEGRPLAKLHGLRMLDPRVFTKLPFSSADSTNIARNIGIDKRWTGSYRPNSKPGRAALLRERIETQNSPLTWAPQ